MSTVRAKMEISAHDLGLEFEQICIQVSVKLDDILAIPFASARAVLSVYERLKTEHFIKSIIEYFHSRIQRRARLAAWIYGTSAPIL